MTAAAPLPCCAYYEQQQRRLPCWCLLISAPVHEYVIFVLYELRFDDSCCAAHVYFVLPQQCQHVLPPTPAPPSPSRRDSHHIRYVCFPPPWCSKRGVVLWLFDVVNSTPSKYGGVGCACVRGSSAAAAAVRANTYYVSRKRDKGRVLLASRRSR